MPALVGAVVMSSAILLSAQNLWQSLLHPLLVCGGRTGTLSLYMWILMLFPTTLFQGPLLTAQGWVVLKNPAMFFFWQVDSSFSHPLSLLNAVTSYWALVS